MNISALLPWRRKSDASGVLATLELFREIFGGRMSRAGESVSWTTALQVSTVLACARVIGRGLGQVPFKLYREADGRRGPATSHPLYRVLNLKPNPWQTSLEYLETVGLHLVVFHNHYSFINRLRGQVRELIPLEPNLVRPERLADGTVRYHVTGLDGSVQQFPAESIWHIRDMSWSGWVGLDILEKAREAIGLAIATEGAHANLHAKGFQVPGVYSVDGSLTEAQYTKLRDHIVANHTGRNKGLPMLLDRNAKWLAQAMTGVDAQHLETRRFQVEEVCRAMGVMPIMVFHADKAATYASAEAMFRAHQVHTMASHYRRLEQRADADLLSASDYEDGYYTKFVVNALMHVSLKDKGEYIARALGSGGAPAWITQDEARELDELNPMGGAAATLPQPTNVGGPRPQPDPDPPPSNDPSPDDAADPQQIH